jgi:carbamoyltransferase
MLLGITSQNRNASMALIDGDKILWAAQSERYSRIKGDSLINEEMVKEMQEYGEPRRVIWFEQPFQKSLRKLWAGQRPWLTRPRAELKKLGLNQLPIEYVDHHLSHAAAGFYTSKFQDASILVVDGVGEWATVSIWQADHKGLKLKWQEIYPNSMGAFYQSFAEYLGLGPNQEHILLEMATVGNRYNSLVEQIKTDFFSKFQGPDFKLRKNPFESCKWWTRPQDVTDFDIAASVQAVMEEYLQNTAEWMKQNLPSENFVFSGDCAFNVEANSLLAKIYRNIWIAPTPSDSGSAIGAVAAYTKKHLNWEHPYLGTNIKRDLDIDAVVNQLLTGDPVGVANGRAEFGPNALGNRSLFCDPRGEDCKDKINTIKCRDNFRVFELSILEEHAIKYFEMPVKSSPYMQFAAACRDPRSLLSVVQPNKRTRIQTVNSADNPVFRRLLEVWFEKTGCPMLVNTGLSVKNEPLVNTWADAQRFALLNGIKIF